MFFLAADDFVTIIIALVVGGVWVLSQVLRKVASAAQEKPGEGGVGRPPAEGPASGDITDEMRRFFEEVRRKRLEGESRPTPTSRQSVPPRRVTVRRVPVAIPVEEEVPEKPELAGEEGPQGETLTQRMERADQAGPATLGQLEHRKVEAYREKGRKVAHDPLQRLIENPRMGTGARAMVLLEVLGPPVGERGAGGWIEL